MSGTQSRLGSSIWRMTMVICLFLFAIVFLLWTEHRAHLFGALPYLILLACPLMHLFMHRGHRHGGDHRDSATGGLHRHGGES